MELKLEQTAPHQVANSGTRLLALSASKWLTSSSLVLMTISSLPKAGIPYKVGEEQRLRLKVEQSFPPSCAVFLHLLGFSTAEWLELSYLVLMATLECSKGEISFKKCRGTLLEAET